MHFAFRGGTLDLSQPRLMAILNVTPDSFADGGRHERPEAALAQAARLAKEGADILDIGAESTRPGHTPLSAEEEVERLGPVMEALGGTYALPLSIDTYKARTARFALSRGAHIVNDIWGLSRDAEMARVAAGEGAGVVLMHNREGADPALDIVADMIGFFERALEAADAAGLPRSHIMLDPGIGFGKTLAQNLIALKSSAAIRAYFGLPVLVGASRKSFIAKLIPSDPDERLPGTLAAHLLAVREGAHVLRVHDVAAHKQALAVDRAATEAR